MTDLETVQRTLDNRLAPWEAGLRGIVERPVLGWGEANYVVVFGRHVRGQGTIMPASDHAHNQLIEEAATKGVVGLAAYLAIWVLAFLAVFRAARVVDSREQALVLFAGAALLGQFVQLQALFPTASTSLQHVLLLAVIVRFEPLAWSSSPGFRLPGTVARALRSRVAGGCAVLGAAAISAAGLVAHQAIYSGAAALYRAEASKSTRFMDELKNGIEAFGPLANVPRMILFENVTENWMVLRVSQPAEAARLLRWSNIESTRAVEIEPENWMVQHALARLYRAVAKTEPEYAARAQRHFDRALELAPHKDPLVALDAPGWSKGRPRPQ